MTKAPLLTPLLPLLPLLLVYTVPLTLADDGRLLLSPAKDAAIGWLPKSWLTVMAQLATPLALVMPVQVWALLPLPSVMATVSPDGARPAALIVAASVWDCPCCTDVSPLMVMLVERMSTVRVPGT